MKRLYHFNSKKIIYLHVKSHNISNLKFSTSDSKYTKNSFENSFCLNQRKFQTKLKVSQCTKIKITEQKSPDPLRQSDFSILPNTIQYL